MPPYQNPQSRLTLPYTEQKLKALMLDRDANKKQIEQLQSALIMAKQIRW